MTDAYSNTHPSLSSGASSRVDAIGGRVGDLRGKLIGGFGRLVDQIEPHISKAPADMQPAARKAVEVARNRPLLTMAGLALGALVLARGASRR